MKATLFAVVLFNYPPPLSAQAGNTERRKTQIKVRIVDVIAEGDGDVVAK
jgi:hypothetical protein